MPFLGAIKPELADRRPSAATVRPVVITNESTIKYAGTINISMCKMFSKRKWRDFSSEEQRTVLSNVLDDAIRIYLPSSFELIKKVYETCPTYGQQHIHFCLVNNEPDVYSFDERFVPYIEYIVGLPERFKYKTIHIRPIYDEAGWDKYIMKDQQ